MEEEKKLEDLIDEAEHIIGEDREYRKPTVPISIYERDFIQMETRFLCRLDDFIQDLGTRYLSSYDDIRLKKMMDQFKLLTAQYDCLETMKHDRKTDRDKHPHVFISKE